jgi:hypothetical protein
MSPDSKPGGGSFGKLGLEACVPVGLNFQATQKVATNHASQGIMRGFQNYDLPRNRTISADRRNRTSV